MSRAWDARLTKYGTVACPHLLIYTRTPKPHPTQPAPHQPCQTEWPSQKLPMLLPFTSSPCYRFPHQKLPVLLPFISPSEASHAAAPLCGPEHKHTVPRLHNIGPGRVGGDVVEAPEGVLGLGPE